MILNDLQPSELTAHPCQLINEVFARYVRAADHRDESQMAALFTAEANLTIYYRGNGTDELLGHLSGSSNIGAAVTLGMAPHPPLGWSHHTVLNPIVSVGNDTAEYDAQFLVYDVVGSTRPMAGWPPGTSGAQGSIVPIESGYYRATLCRNDTGWLIADMTIRHDLPYVFPSN